MLKLCDTTVTRATTPDEVPGVVSAAIDLAFKEERAAAVLLSQQLIGKKVLRELEDGDTVMVRNPDGAQSNEFSYYAYP